VQQNLVSDLGVTKTLAGGGDTFDGEEEVTFVIVIHNYGPAPTNGFRLRDIFPAGDFKITSVEQVNGPRPLEEPRKAVLGFFEGKWGELKEDEEIHVLVRGIARNFFIVPPTNNASVFHLDGSRRVEPTVDPHPNQVIISLKVNPAPDSTIKKVGAKKASGTTRPPREPDAQVMSAGARAGASATRVKRVQVAILRLGGGRPFTQLPARRTKRRGKCKWLKNRRGKFKGRRARNKVCDSPIWLKARGTRRWRLRLRRRLPPGRYVLYSRAVSSNGAAEGNFTAKDKNRKRFRVRKRRRAR
jgi:uncharacterized repeat protein (TIGR01451 family)